MKDTMDSYGMKRAATIIRNQKIMEKEIEINNDDEADEMQKAIKITQLRNTNRKQT